MTRNSIEFSYSRLGFVFRSYFLAQTRLWNLTSKERAFLALNYRNSARYSIRLSPPRRALQLGFYFYLSDWTLEFQRREGQFLPTSPLARYMLLRLVLWCLASISTFRNRLWNLTNKRSGFPCLKRDFGLDFEVYCKGSVFLPWVSLHSEVALSPIIISLASLFLHVGL